MNRSRKKLLITGAQMRHLMFDWRGGESLWTAACRVAGWDKSDRDFRIAKFSEFLKRPIKSASEIGAIAEFTELKSALLAIAQPANFNAQVKLANMELQNLQARIELEAQRIGWEPVLKMARDKFGHDDLGRLDAKQLGQLRSTLERWQQGWVDAPAEEAVQAAPVQEQTKFAGGVEKPF